MSNFPSQERVVQAVLEGITQAEKNFLFWTNNRLSLSSGPQKILCIHVAQALGLIENAPEVFIDASVSDILRCSLPNRKAFKTFMEKNALSQGAFSITLDERFVHHNHNDSISRVIMTLKNGVCNAKAEYTFEIERLCKMLQRKSKNESLLDYGIFAFYADISTQARKKLAKRIPEIVHSFDEVVNRFPSLSSNFYATPITQVEELGEWAAGCYVIFPK
ncbi:MAG: hypothetical protein EOM49_01180 [Epsilonproteobacteria bacterium]|jgi:hypothetical protein|uniref:hypothetical protein n=1 Tax=Sulfurospirillum TaxID=57665 RepID=UPI000542FFD9|nr:MULTISPECIES: hypothetical protein [Sulfurospirillum]MCD8543474.1 hypothetical protein [Sulfurospirillum cavolei]NCB53547.1 hypothetical protein [Campylobacterota bacterium]KHG34907.1 MAG: hypothetical protein OA34_01765 [Sulfurospirillum sp. MES]MCP3652162.1 hypothetical protein [Sulfurospirillum sp. DNRA8]MCR1811012.1 hypothetical protein [Sulfurospirillum sp. DNRA8]